MRHALALLIAALLVALSAAAALAHAGLVATSPTDGARLAQMPAAITLTFSEPVAPMGLTLTGSDGSSLPLTAKQDGTTLVAPLPAMAGPGGYLLSWRITSADGHPVSGALVFTVGNGTPPIATAATGGATLTGAAIWAVRLLQYAAMLVGVGSIGMAHILGATVNQTLPRTLAATGLLLVPVALVLQGLDLTGGTLPGDPGPAITAAMQSSYGWTQLVLGTSFALSLFPARHAAVLALLTAAIAPALSGHASTAAPQWAMRGAVTLHMAALLGWIGSLWPLFLALRQDRRAALLRFSRLIPPLIGILIASGLAMAAVQMGWPAPAWTSAYAMLLGAKLGLVMVLLALGLWNRIRLTPWALNGRAAPLCRSIGIELGVAIVVLALVAGWRFTAPPRVLSAIAEARMPATAELTGDGTATLVLTPGPTGSLTGELTLRLNKPARQVTLLLANPSRGIAPLSRIASPQDAMRWRIDDVILPVGGTWQATLHARLDRFTQATLTGTISLKGRQETTMNRTLLAATTAAVLAAAPALAHEGVLHDGCPTGQSFTAGDITVTGAFTRQTPPAAQSAGGYMTIANGGVEGDTLLGATSEAVRNIGIHEMKMKGDVMEMGEVEGGLAIPAGGTVQLMPKGYHLMMMGPGQPFHQGECVAVTLHFARAGDVTVTLNVGGLAQQTPPGADEQGNGMDHDMSGMDHDMSEMSSMSAN